MKLMVVGHSMIHIRQQKFFQALGEDFEVVLVSPSSWNNQSTQPRAENNFKIITLRHTKHQDSEDIYRYKLLGLKECLEEESPDILYVHAEPGSVMTLDAIECSKAKKNVLFTWENLEANYTPFGREILSRYDQIICGNGEAERLIKASNTNTIILPQVGVDTDHFQERDIEKVFGVCYFGRPTEEKGVKQLAIAWPLAQVIVWKDYLDLPWWYSMAKTVVCFSQDSAHWKEQAMPYVAVEALCCGALPVVSDAGAIPYWLDGGFASPCPGAALVPQSSTGALKKTLEIVLSSDTKRAQMVADGRKWVESVLSTRAIAKQLSQALTA